jgi:hypothetical protein
MPRHDRRGRHRLRVLLAMIRGRLPVVVPERVWAAVYHGC